MKNGTDTTQIELFFNLAVLAFSTILISMLIQASVWVSNKLIRPGRGRDGSDGSIPSPSVRGAILISLIAVAVEFAVNTLVIGFLGVKKQDFEQRLQEDIPFALTYCIASLVAGFVAWWGLFTIALPTSATRAALVSLVLHLLTILLAVVLIVPVVGIYQLTR